MSGCTTPGTLDLEAALRRALRQLCAPANDTWRAEALRAWEALGGPPAGEDPFFSQWAALDFAPPGEHPLARIIAAADHLALAQRAALATLATCPPRLLLAPAGGGGALTDALTGQPWPTALAALVPPGGAALTRVVWRPGAARQVGPLYRVSPGPALAHARRLLAAGGSTPRPWRDPIRRWRSAAPALYGLLCVRVATPLGPPLRPWAIQT